MGTSPPAMITGMIESDECRIRFKIIGSGEREEVVESVSHDLLFGR